jgi:DNA polymerase-3 subunit epsilon
MKIIICIVIAYIVIIAIYRIRENAKNKKKSETPTVIPKVDLPKEDEIPDIPHSTTNFDNIYPSCRSPRSIKEFVAIDFETATGSRNSACQLGVAVYKNGACIEEKSFLIQPPSNEYSQINTKIHGMSAKTTANAETFMEQWPNIKPYINDKIIVAHNAPFDMSVLTSTAALYDIEDLNIKECFCTYQLTGLALVEASQGYGVKMNGHHDAINDAKMCGDIFVHICNGDKLYESLIKVRKGGKKESDQESVNKAECSDCNIFCAKTVVVTGVFGCLNRDDIKDVIASKGGLIRNTISGKTEIVVMGIDAGPVKIQKIHDLQHAGKNIRIIEEDELRTILNL